MKGKSITFRPNRDHRERLETLASRTERTLSQLIEKCIAAHLPALEQKYAADTDKQVRDIEEAEQVRLLSSGSRGPAKPGGDTSKKPESDARALPEPKPNPATAPPSSTPNGAGRSRLARKNKPSSNRSS